MLVLSRKLGENVRIGDFLMVTILNIRAGRVQLALNQQTADEAEWKIEGQVTTVAPNVTVMVTLIRTRRVKLGIEAPPEIKIHRGEVYDRIKADVPRPATMSPAEPDSSRQAS